MPDPNVGMGFIYGWRLFDVAGDGHLVSPNRRTTWSVDPAPKAASCERRGYYRSRDGAPHTVVPDISCSCGYYCFDTFPPVTWWATTDEDWIHPYQAVALCRAWGGIVLHSNGFRSQFLAIDELWMNANAQARSLTRNLYRSFRVRNLENFRERKNRLLKVTAPRALKDIVWIPSAEADLEGYDGPRSARSTKLRTKKKTRKNLNPGSSQKKIAPREQDPKTKWWW